MIQSLKMTGGLKKAMTFFKFVKPYRWAMVIGIISLILVTLISLAFPFLAGKLIDMAGGKTDDMFYSVGQIVFLLIAFIVVQSILSFSRSYAFAFVGEKCLADLRHLLYDKIVWLPQSFFNSTRIGELMSRITADVWTLQETFSYVIAEFLRQGLTLLIGTIIIFVLTPKLTIFMLLTFPFLVVIGVYFGSKIRKYATTTQKLFAHTNVIVEETLQAINVVKSFTNENFESQRYKYSLVHAVSGSLKAARYRSFFTALITLILTGGIVAVSWYGTMLVQSGEITTGELFSFVLYTGFIGASIAGIGELYAQVQRSIGASERVLEILQTEDEKVTQCEPCKIQGDIIFDKVSFSYPDRNGLKVLTNISFQIGAGEKVALVGPSGSGKSTIINLLLRLYTIEHGSIIVDGKNANKYNLTSYRENIGLVPQEIILFGGTIRENIGYGKLGATDKEIMEAAGKANALEFIDSFPDKFNTVVGDRGIKLSGGQRQRIAIARVILKNPSILILDEATSSLDATSERSVQDALEKLMAQRTTIIIAHRLSTVRKVDRIFVIKDGTIVETGSHDELKLKEKGVYSKLLYDHSAISQ